MPVRALGLALALQAAATQDVSFVESRLDFGAADFHYQFVEMNDDGRVDLLLTTVEDGLSSLRLHLHRADGSFESEADWRMSLPGDVVTYTPFDLRDDPGLELLLLTRSGVFSVSPWREGLQGNLRRELSLRLFPNLAPSSAVSRWRFAADLDGDDEFELFLPSEGQLLCMAAPRSPAGPRQLAAVGQLPCRISERDRDTRVQFGQRGSMNLSVTAPAPRFFPGLRSSRPRFPLGTLLSRSDRWTLPSLLDWNGDGFLDGVFVDDDHVMVRQWSPDLSAFQDAVTFAYPEVVDAEEDRDVRLRDLDGDGDFEAVLTSNEGSGTSRDYVLVILPCRPGEGFAETPSARIKLAATGVQYTFEDVDGDGVQDLLARAIDVPTSITSLANVRLDLSLLVYRGLPEGRLAKEPEVRIERRLRPEQMERIQETFVANFAGDFHGDGLNDLIMMQPDGLLSMTRLRRTGSGLSLENEPWTRYRPPSLVEGVETWDLSSDGVSDLVLRHEQMLTVFVSRGSP